jgi:hypothetical protein
MTSHPYQCEWCGQAWTNAISSVLCCDEVANSIPTED